MVRLMVLFGFRQSCTFCTRKHVGAHSALLLRVHDLSQLTWRVPAHGACRATNRDQAATTGCQQVVSIEIFEQQNFYKSILQQLRLSGACNSN